MRTLRRLLVVGIFAALFTATWKFARENGQEVSVWLGPWVPSLPLWQALIGSFALGALSAGASLVYELAKKSFTARRYRKQMAGLESEIHQLRNLPLAAPEPADRPAPPRGGLADDLGRLGR